MTLDTAVLADLAAIRAALHEAGVCLNWSPGYSYFGDDGKVHDDHGPVEHTEGERVLAALHDAGYGVALLSEVELLRNLRAAVLGWLDCPRCSAATGTVCMTHRPALRAALVSEEGSR